MDGGNGGTPPPMFLSSVQFHVMDMEEHIFYDSIRYVYAT